MTFTRPIVIILGPFDDPFTEIEYMVLMPDTYQGVARKPAIAPRLRSTRVADPFSFG